MGTFEPLKGISGVFDSTLNNDIQDGLVEYFDWALLTKGNYFNVVANETSPNGEDMSRLRLSTNDSYTAGQVWEGFRKNWVWQSGISVNGFSAPLVGTNNQYPGISGVYVDGDFHPTSEAGAYAHHVDYFNGRVIFDSPIPTGSVVKAEHSYKYINVMYANNMPWYKQLQSRTLEPSTSFLDSDDGPWNIPPENRAQLPLVAIEVVPNRTFKGYQLGGGQLVYTDVLFHCIAEDEVTRNQLVDIISLQNDKTIHIFNNNKININGDFPLDYRGTPVSGALRYPDLIDQYNGGKLRLTKTTVQQMIMHNTTVFGGVVRMTTEGVKTNI
tara:strand:- start:1742 stop:2722 length:981 start_codon:yes stop_codon:yes gene_type:complete